MKESNYEDDERLLDDYDDRSLSNEKLLNISDDGKSIDDNISESDSEIGIDGIGNLKNIKNINDLSSNIIINENKINPAPKKTTVRRKNTEVKFDYKQSKAYKDGDTTSLLIGNYHRKETLSGKFESYLDLQLHKHEMESLGFNFDAREAEDIKACEDNFMKEFSNVSEKSRNTLLRRISEKKIEFAEKYSEERKAISNIVGNEAELKKTKTAYVAGGGAYATKLKALDSIEQQLVEKKVVLDTPVDHNTSMKQFSKMLGLSDDDALAYLKDKEPKLINAKKKPAAAPVDDDEFDMNDIFNFKKPAAKKKGQQSEFETYNNKTATQSVYRYFNFKVGQPKFKEMVEKGEILLPQAQADLIKKETGETIKLSRQVNGVVLTDQDYVNYPSLLKDVDVLSEAERYDYEVVHGDNGIYASKIKNTTDLFFRNVKVDPKDYQKAVDDEIIKYKKDPTIEANMKAAFAKKKISPDKAREIKSLINEATKGPNTNRINDWIASKGDDLKNTVNASVMRGLAADDKARLMPGKGYDKYILLHTGHNAYFNDPKKAPDNLSKALAADILKMSDNIKFDVNTIHKVADNIKKMPEYKNISKDPVRLMSSLSDPAAVASTCKNIIKKTYGVPQDSISEYINKMEKLYNSMKPQGSQSTEYKNFRNSIKSIVDLKSNMDLKTSKGREAASEAIVKLNAKLLQNSEVYMKGKKSVRGSNEGQHRFNNTLDALGLMCQYAPDTKNQIMVSVNRINSVRKAQPGSENYVDITNHNEKRAVAERNAMDKNRGKALRSNAIVQ